MFECASYLDCAFEAIADPTNEIDVQPVTKAARLETVYGLRLCGRWHVVLTVARYRGNRGVTPATENCFWSPRTSKQRLV